MRAIVFVVLSVTVLFSAASAAQAAELPVRKVVLYKHGIGFFERLGTVPAGESAELQFKTEEMNDVLKSLTIVSRGEVVSGVRYDSNEPLSEKLKAFPFRIGEAQPLSRILDQFKGAPVRLRLAGDEIEGTIISSRSTAPSENHPERHELILLMQNGDIRTIDPAAAAGLRFVDDKLQEQFREYLMLIAGSRNLDKRSVTIESSGQGARDVSARYVTPMPVWKSSYRLVFDDQTQPLLEGWAIVDNTTGEDWSNVTLSFVSGMPVSFISRLYEPRYVERPVAELAQDRAQRPIVHGGAIGGEVETAQAFRAEDEDRARRQAAAKAMAPGEQIAGIAGRRFEAEEMSADAIGQMRDAPAAPMPSTLAQTAAAQELGELFEYRIDQPVTVRRGESAMLPFLQQRVDGRKLLIFNEAHGSQHPLNAVELTNSSGKTLDGGAITVFDAGAYAGEALMETVKGGDKRLISYAVDLGTRISTAFDSSSKMISEFTLRRGILTIRRSVKEIRTYTIHNVDQKTKTVIVERAVRAAYEPVEPKPSEKTADSYRYEVKVAAGATEKFPVTEERIVSNTLALTNLTYDQLITYVRNKELNEAGRAKLQQVADVKRQIADTDREIQLLEKQIQELTQDQDRLRRNISSLRSVSGQEQQVQAYALKLSEQEGQLVGMQDQLAKLRRQREDLQTKLNTLIETLEI